MAIVVVVVMVVVVISEGGGSDGRLVGSGSERLDVARRHGSTQSREGNGALLALGYRVGRRVFLLPLPEKILAKTAGEFLLKHVPARGLGRHGRGMHVGGGHDDGFGPARLVTHHQAGVFLRRIAGRGSVGRRAARAADGGRGARGLLL